VGDLGRLLVLICVAAAFLVGQGPPVITHGVATGDVTADSAIVWSRADHAATMHARVWPADGSGAAGEWSAAAPAAAHFTAQVRVTGLRPDTAYRYEIWFETSAGRSTTQAGTFRTAPAPDARNDVLFIWAGDLGGQGYCRQPGAGYAIFEPMLVLQPDFFVANGDMIYGDNDCPAQGPVAGWTNIPGDFPAVSHATVDWRDRARVESVYAAHWLYNRADPLFQAFTRDVPMYAQWDDHEVINDFGAPWEAYPETPERPGYPNIVAAGLKTFFDFHPIARHPTEPDRIYRSYRRGRDVELFLLDARSYRSDNRLEDSPANAKTLLGREQLEWLKAGLAGSSATWKIVSSDVPLSAPTGAETVGRDAFANQSRSAAAARTGFEIELVDLIRAIDAADVRNLVFVTTDVHFAAQLRYAGDYDGDGDQLVFHELISGPLSAVRIGVPTFDRTLGPELLYAEGNFFNFGTVRIDRADGGTTRLRADIRDERGAVRPGSVLEIAAEAGAVPPRPDHRDPEQVRHQQVRDLQRHRRQQQQRDQPDGDLRRDEREDQLAGAGPV